MCDFLNAEITTLNGTNPIMQWKYDTKINLCLNTDIAGNDLRKLLHKVFLINAPVYTLYKVMKKLENRKLSPQFLKVFSSKTTPPLTWNMNMESFMEYMTAMVSPTILEI